MKNKVTAHDKKHTTFKQIIKIDCEKDTTVIHLTHEFKLRDQVFKGAAKKLKNNHLTKMW